jgi:hypothetical protein
MYEIIGSELLRQLTARGDGSFPFVEANGRTKKGELLRESDRSDL